MRDLVSRLVWGAAFMVAGLFTDVGLVLDYISDPAKYHGMQEEDGGGA